VLVGLTLLVHVPGGGGALDPEALFHRFLPQHDVTPGLDPLEPIERLLASILRNRESVSLVAGPTFLWFSSRLFASMRNSLSFVYDTQAEPPVRRGIIRAFLHNKSRDLAVALVVVVLLLANTLLSAGIALVRARGATLAPPWSLLLGELGRFLAPQACGRSPLTFPLVPVRRDAWLSRRRSQPSSGARLRARKRLFGLPPPGP
jgi:hypothetical protein